MYLLKIYDLHLIEYSITISDTYTGYTYTLYLNVCIYIYIYTHVIYTYFLKISPFYIVEQNEITVSVIEYSEENKVKRK